MILKLFLLLIVFIYGCLSNGGDYISPDGKVTIKWRIYGDIIVFNATAISPGWVGIGLSERSDMSDTDFIIGYQNVNGTFVSDAYNRQTSFPPSDTSFGGTDDLFDKSFSKEGDTVKLNFARKLVTGDPYDKEIGDKAMYLLYAFGSVSSVSGIPSYHSSNRAAILVNLLAKKQYQSPDGKWLLKWSFNDRVDTINFALELKYNGWAGVGISETGRMDDSDFIIAYFDQRGEFHIDDRYENPNAESGRGRPEFDTNLGGTDDLFDKSAMFVNQSGVITQYFNFSRKTVTKDSKDIEIGEKQIYLLYAYGNISPNGDLSKHANTGRGSVEMNFEEGEIIPPQYKTDFRVIHASFMVIAWVFLAVPGMMISRYFKFIVTSWFKYHWVLNVSALLLAYMALILILIYLEEVPKVAHAYLGLITLGLTLIQATIGFVSNKMWYEGKPPAWWPDKAHWWLGRLVLVLALINIFLGMNILQEQSTPFILFATWLGITVVFMIYLELQVGQKNEYESINEDKTSTTVSFAFKAFMIYWCVTALFCILSIFFTVKK